MYEMPTNQSRMFNLDNLQNQEAYATNSTKFENPTAATIVYIHFLNISPRVESFMKYCLRGKFF